jgi:polyribonucleotide nucleotidyltransferase
LEEQVTDEIHIDPKWHKNFKAKQGKLISEISDENCNVKISFPKLQAAATAAASNGTAATATATATATAASNEPVQLKGPKDAVEAAKRRILEYVHRLENQVSLQVVIPQQHHAALIGKGGANSQKISDEFRVNILFQAKSHNEQDASAAATASAENGSAESTAEEATNGHAHPGSPSKSADVVIISGFKDDCEKAREALLALVPVSEEVKFAAKFHKDLLADKAKLLRDFTQKYNVQVNVPKKSSADEAQNDHVSVVGAREHIAEARQALLDLADELEAKNFQIELTNVKADLIPQLRGRNGAEAGKLEKKFDVKIDFSKKGEPDRICIRGLRANVEACDAFLRKKIEDEDAKLSMEIQIDNRVHSRIIGAQGKALAKITDKYKVEVKFAGRQSDQVVVKGADMDAIEEACDHLKNLEEEYLQDVTDREQYMHPSSKPAQGGQANANGQSKGFVVRGAPWEQHNNNNNDSPVVVPDTNNMEDFPTITSAGGEGSSNGQKSMSWGPSRK